MRAYQPNEDLRWREVYGQEYRAAEDRGLESWKAREVAAKAAWADYEERTGQPALLRNATSPEEDECQRIELGIRPECPLCGHSNWTYELRPGLFACQRHRETAIERPFGSLRAEQTCPECLYEQRTGKVAPIEHSCEADGENFARLGHQPNGVSYYVWALARGSDAPLDEGPWGPYDNLDSAKTFARIAATEGKHDRAVSCGLNPRSPSFKIVRRYEAGTGKRLL